MPKRLKHFDYPYHFELCRVSRNSGIRWRHRWVQVSSTLQRNVPALKKQKMVFCELLIGRFREETMKVVDVFTRVPVRQAVVECKNPKMRRNA